MSLTLGMSYKIRPFTNRPGFFELTLVSED